MTEYHEKKYRENCKDKCIRLTALFCRETTSIQLNQGGYLPKKMLLHNTVASLQSIL